MHIHINREGFTDDAHQLRFTRFLVDQIDTEFLKNYVGETRYNRQITNNGGYARKEFDVEGIDHITANSRLSCDTRYAMVSLFPEETIELRFFAATTNASKLRANVQFAAAAREFTRHFPCPIWMEFIMYVKKRHKKYPDLVSRIYRFSTSQHREFVGV